MDIDDTARRIHKTAADHGFWDKPRNLGEMLMLVASELAECLEEDRAGKPLVYWKCKFCGRETASEPDIDYGAHRLPSGNTKSNRLMRWFLDMLGRDVYCPKWDEWKPEGALVEVADAIIRLLDTGHEMASRSRYTLGQVIDIKMDYNMSREFMHGKAY